MGLETQDPGHARGPPRCSAPFHGRRWPKAELACALLRVSRATCGTGSRVEGHRACRQARAPRHPSGDGPIGLRSQTLLACRSRTTPPACARTPRTASPADPAAPRRDPPGWGRPRAREPGPCEHGATHHKSLLFSGPRLARPRSGTSDTAWGRGHWVLPGPPFCGGDTDVPGPCGAGNVAVKPRGIKSQLRPAGGDRDGPQSLAGGGTPQPEGPRPLSWTGACLAVCGRQSDVTRGPGSRAGSSRSQGQAARRGVRSQQSRSSPPPGAPRSRPAWPQGGDTNGPHLVTGEAAESSWSSFKTGTRLSVRDTAGTPTGFARGWRAQRAVLMRLEVPGTETPPTVVLRWTQASGPARTWMCPPSTGTSWACARRSPSSTRTVGTQTFVA